jgi:hypothetical protein
MNVPLRVCPGVGPAFQPDFRRAAFFAGHCVRPESRTYVPDRLLLLRRGRVDLLGVDEELRVGAQLVQGRVELEGFEFLPVELDRGELRGEGEVDVRSLLAVLIGPGLGEGEAGVGGRVGDDGVDRPAGVGPELFDLPLAVGALRGGVELGGAGQEALGIRRVLM